MVFDSQAAIWLVILVLLLIMEAATMGLTTIWFAGGALVGFLLALAGINIWIQIIAFCAVSVILLVFTRPAAAKYLNRDRIRTNAESLIGRTAVVTEQIDNLSGKGQVQIQGQYWTARTEQDGTLIPEHSKVEIVQISGVKLIVKEEVSL